MTRPTLEHHPSDLPLPFSSAVAAGDFLFLSGQIALGADGRLAEGGIGAQTRGAMDRIAAVLAQCGAGMRDVVRATVWLADLADFPAFNEAYRAYFPDGRFPARSTVRADLAMGAAVEIEVQALRPGARA